MLTALLDNITSEIKPFIDIPDFETLFESEIKKDLESLENGYFIKISDFKNGKDDGIYLSKNNKYMIHIVKNSFKNDKEIESNDFCNLLTYSYIVRALSYMENSPFDVIRTFTKKTNIIINKYLN